MSVTTTTTKNMLSANADSSECSLSNLPTDIWTKHLVNYLQTEDLAALSQTGVLSNTHVHEYLQHKFYCSDDLHELRVKDRNAATSLQTQLETGNIILKNNQEDDEKKTSTFSLTAVLRAFYETIQTVYASERVQWVKQALYKVIRAAAACLVPIFLLYTLREAAIFILCLGGVVRYGQIASRKQRAAALAAKDESSTPLRRNKSECNLKKKMILRRSSSSFSLKSSKSSPMLLSMMEGSDLGSQDGDSSSLIDPLLSSSAITDELAYTHQPMLRSSSTISEETIATNAPQQVRVVTGCLGNYLRLCQEATRQLKAIHRAELKSQFESLPEMEQDALIDELERACMENDVESITRLSTQLVLDDVYEMAGSVKTALHAAAFYGAVDVLKELLSREAHLLDVTDADGWTALHYCASSNRDEAAKSLLDAGADVTLLTSDGYTAEQLATRLQHTETATALLESKNNTKRSNYHYTVCLVGVILLQVLAISAITETYELRYCFGNA